MKSFVFVTLALVAAVAAAPVVEVESQTESDLELVNSNYVKSVDGSYTYGFEVKNGNKRFEEGTLKEVKDKDDEKVIHVVIVTRGNYTLNDAQGKPHVMTYVADENGFFVKGDLVPKDENTKRVLVVV